MSFEIKKQEEIINDLLVYIVQNVSEINDINTGSVIRTLTEGIAQEIYYQYTQIQNVYNGTRITSASGDDLDNIGSIIGVTRLLGNKAAGIVTFERDSTASSNFVINAGSIVSTQPGVAETYNFITKNDTTFIATILNEDLYFIDGIWKYKLSQRKVGSIISVSGTKSGTPASFIRNTDFIITDYQGYISTANITTLDDCETADWSQSTDATADALDASNYIEGNHSIKLGKSGTSSTSAYYYKTISTADIEDKKVNINIKVVDQTTLDKIDKIYIRVSSDTTPINNYYQMKIDNSDLELDFKTFTLNYKDISSVTQAGSPNPVQIKSLRLEIVTNNASDTITSGKILMDFWHSSTAEYYSGEIIQWLGPSFYPDDSTHFYVDWQPLSVDIDCESEKIGADYNAGIGKIIYKVSSIPYIDRVYNYETFTNGQNQETDDSYRARIISNASSPGKATTNALKNAILSLNGVQSVVVTDMPIRTIQDEPNIYNTNVTKYKLDNEVAFVDNEVSPTNILITNTYGGTADYTYGTDYQLTSNSEIEWLGATVPSSAAVFYTDYQCHWLGHVEILVSGIASPISTTLASDIDDTIAEVKAAGISVTWSEPIRNDINITATVTVDTAAGYNATIVKSNVQTATINWLNSMAIGEDVLVSEFIYVAMQIEGVENVTITNWDGDTVAPFSDIIIANDNIARPEDSGIIIN